MSLIEKHEQVDNANFKLLAALHQNKLLSHLNSETNLRHSTSRVPPGSTSILTTQTDALEK